MIGVIPNKHEIEIVEEFFQLFKTPWEFYDEDRDYEVVIVTNSNIREVNAKLLIIYGSEKNQFDYNEDITLSPTRGKVFVQYGDVEIPIYGNISALEGVGKPTIKVKGSSTIAALEIEHSSGTILRIGYSLFEEIRFLLSEGQPHANARIPTLEHHIAILRGWILNMGIPLVEIPPAPLGYDFVVCLTHDVDFVRIRDHKFDHTMFGFLYRATLGTLLNCLKKKIPWSNLLKNFLAALTLPFVYLGLVKDFWTQFDRYMSIEKDLPSTYFFIPFKNRTGCDPQHRTSKKRSAKYDITDVKPEVAKLRDHGDEIGLHGIDAWHDRKLAHEESHRISLIANQSHIGVRMHWLCFNHNSFKILDEAGFSYDSTYGYNNAIGFRGGTTQAFQPIGIKKLLEIPLHIQDNALFFTSGKRLSQSEAWEECNKVVETTRTYGGVLTILWHQRSIAPERLYEEFYINLLNYLKKDHNVWFATGGQIVEWFRKRRNFSFKDIQCFDETVKVKYSDIRTDTIPPLMLRIHKRKYSDKDMLNSMNTETNFTDVLLTGNVDETFSLIAN